MPKIVIANSPAGLVPVFLMLADHDPRASLLSIWETGKRYEDCYDDCIVGSFKHDLYGFLRELACEIGTDLGSASLATALPVLLNYAYVAYGDTDLGFIFEIDDVDEEPVRSRLHELRADFSDICSCDEAEILALLEKWYPDSFLDDIRHLKTDVDKVRA